jgi:hypothetical protein
MQTPMQSHKAPRPPGLPPPELISPDKHSQATDFDTNIFAHSLISEVISFATYTQLRFALKEGCKILHIIRGRKTIHSINNKHTYIQLSHY